MTQKLSKKKKQILSHASRLFNEIGYNDTRLEDIAKQVGTGKTNISYHFRSKDVILEELYDRSFEFAKNAVDTASKANSGLQKTIAFVRIHLQGHANVLCEEQSQLTLLRDFDSFDEPAKSTFANRFDGQVEDFQNFLREGISDGSVDIASIQAATFLVYSLIANAPAWLTTINPFKHDEAIDRLCNLLIDGLFFGNSSKTAPPLNRKIHYDLSAVFDREARNKLKKEAFLRTGIRHLNSRGFRNVSLDDIAKELGVTRGAFYYQIADKDELIRQAFERSFHLTEEALILAREQNSNSAAHELEQSLRWLFEGHITNLDPLIKLQLTNALGPGERAAAKARYNRLLASYSELIAKGIMDGSIRNTDIENLSHIVLGSIYSASSYRFANTRLYQNWQPLESPLAASLAYLEPLFYGFARKS